MPKLLPALACVLALAVAARHAAADTYPRQHAVDALHYVFRLTLSDTSNEIHGETTATFRIVKPDVKELSLDLISGTGGKGMTVESVSSRAQPLRYSHHVGRLAITLQAAHGAGEEISITVRYHGVPIDGLRIIDNIHGDRTAFSENWPDRARHWLPLVDHPYDKATGEFIVTAPAGYQIVANGLLIEELDLPDGQRRTHWRQSVPIASWLYALGMARFATHHYAVVRGIPQQVWVFPQNRDQGYELFAATGRRAFEYFSDWIGPYPYEKLAHVQAAGMSGGTEHASAIFYGEKGVAGGRAPVVHEVAHQWWGNSVTESDWDDVWLSEGFATYFTHLFAEHTAGREAFVRGLRNDIATIVEAQRRLPDQPVIHRNISDMRGVLNRLVYQKAGWVLHMLRGLVGTDRFWDGIREYYRRYRDRNASTGDFRQVMEQASGMELTWFFDQWLRRPGLASLTGSWTYEAARRRVIVELTQASSQPPYRLPLEIGLTAADGTQRIERVELTGAAGRFEVPADREPSSVMLDPNVWVLMEAPAFKRLGADGAAFGDRRPPRRDQDQRPETRDRRAARSGRSYMARSCFLHLFRHTHAVDR